MRTGFKPALAGSVALGALGAAALQGAAWAQQTDEAEAARAPVELIQVTGTRIERSGFSQPTPMTVIGELELSQGARPNIAQVLNDLPAFRPTVSPAVSVGNTSSGTAPVDLRGLGSARTLTLLNGRRFNGDNNLNLIPSGLVERVEVVTGGASAAYGSGAVAGVVNIILDRNLDGAMLNASTGISSRGDAARHSLSGAFGTPFSGGDGHFMFGVEYVEDRGVTERASRPYLRSAGIVRVNPGDPNDLSTILVPDVHYTNRSAGGLITTGALAGQTFNPDGTIRTFDGPDSRGVGGADGLGLYSDIYGATPFDRLNAYARMSHRVGGAEIWVDATYGRASSDYPVFPDLALGFQTVSADNAFLRPEIRAQLAAAGETSFTLGRVFNDIFLYGFDLVRENREVAAGVDGQVGRWNYSAYYSYGELESDQSVPNARIAANYARAVNAVTDGSGQIVCAVNLDPDPANRDPSCVPLNIFGSGAASPEALDYVRGVQNQRSVSSLETFGGQVQGDVIDLWAGPLTAVFGGELRWESQDSRRDELTATPGYFGLPVFGQDLAGGFDVKEGFVEIAAPLLARQDRLEIDVNAAARYSDYSFSGGIWAWKVGSTARVFEDVLLRATLSRDIRAPGVGNLFSTRTTNVGPVTDLDDPDGRAAANPNYQRVPSQVFTYSGGNPDLTPELSDTFTVGASITPSALPGFQFSVDYYSMEIQDAIVTLTGSQLTLACANGSQSACDRVERDATGTITTVFANAANIASFDTSGVDVEAVYVRSLDLFGMGGELRLRGLATYIDSFLYDTGVTQTEFVGQVGNTSAQGVPQWRGTFSAAWQTGSFGVDARVRYVGGGLFDRAQTTLVNNRISSRTYVDLGVQYRPVEGLTLYGNANNVFDVDAPLSTAGPIHYDAIGSYYTVGVRKSF
jgi:iron complex outermembrane recepter protein